MVDEENSPPRRPQRQYLAQSIAGLFVAVDEVHAELTSQGSVREDVRQQLQSELASVIFQLRQYRSEDAVAWEEATPFDGGPDALLQAMLQGREGERVPQGQHNAKPQRSREPVAIDAERLYYSAMDVIDIARSLGLSAEIDQSKEMAEAEF